MISPPLLFRAPIASMAAVLVLWLGLAVTAVEAAPAFRGLDDYAVTIWNENDGLFASRVMVLEQGRDGFLWVGTDIGLLRFDGVRFEPRWWTGAFRRGGHGPPQRT